VHKTGLWEEEFVERLEWFIAIRWISVVFIIITALAAANLFSVSLPILPIFLITLFIAIYNAGFKFYIQTVKLRIRSADIRSSESGANLLASIRKLAIIQSMLDIISLTIVIHFTGGAENPFIFYFIFHTILTSILLSKKAAYIQAGIISILTVGLFTLEYLNAVPHHSINGFLGIDLYKNHIYTAAISFVFTSTIFIATFFTASLAERLKNREKELEEAHLKLLEKDRLKDDYVKMVSHDLKSPLASIQSLLEVVIGGFAGTLDEKVREVLQRIQKKIEFLHHYAKDLLDLSRIRAEKNLNLKIFNVKEPIDLAVEIASPKMGEKDIQFSLEIDEQLPDIEADRELITYAFLNLIANAFKYTEPGGKVWIRVSRKTGYIIVEVKDTGIGIPSQDIPHIFEEFFRAGNVIKTTKGTGLGLALTKHIIERHGGNISIESELGKGTTFRFMLPIGAAQK
jgi:signal transduction histidine kinase